jgi:hypothetical protein
MPQALTCTTSAKTSVEHKPLVLTERQWNDWEAWTEVDRMDSFGLTSHHLNSCLRKDIVDALVEDLGEGDYLISPDFHGRLRAKYKQGGLRDQCNGCEILCA